MLSPSFSFSVNASRVPVGELGTGDLMLIVDVELYPAELIATGEVDQGFYDVTYRFAQPPGGWPYFRSTIALAPEFRAPPLPLQPGALPERLFQTITMIERPLAPGPSIIPLMDYGSADALSADSFELDEVDVVGSSDDELLLEEESEPLAEASDALLLDEVSLDDSLELESVEVEEKHVPFFKTGKLLRDRLNGE